MERSLVASGCGSSYKRCPKDICKKNNCYDQQNFKSLGQIDQGGNTTTISILRFSLSSERLRHDQLQDVCDSSIRS